MATTIETNPFFCLSCRLTGELDLHGRCATCGSDAVTHPLRYRLSLLEANECIREKKAPLAAEPRGMAKTLIAISQLRE